MKMIDRKQISDLLGVSVKTITLMIRERGLPMAQFGREYKGDEEEIMRWIRSHYSDSYQSLLDRAGEVVKTTRNRGQLSMEEYGIVEDAKGQRRVVEGKEYIKFRKDFEIGKEHLVSIQHRGTCSFEQSVKEPIFERVKK